MKLEKSHFNIFLLVEILKQIRRVELRYPTMGNLLLRPSAVPKDCKIYWFIYSSLIPESSISYTFFLFQPLADVARHVQTGYKMEAPEGCPTEIYDMMRATWELNVDKRPSFSDLKPILAQIKATTT